MLICPKCDSKDIEMNDENFLPLEPEGQPAKRQAGDKKFFRCRGCEEVWESIPEAEQDYSEYIQLREKTRIEAHTLKRGGSYGPVPYINANELLRRHELAKKIASSYKHVLDIGFGKWLEIKKDAS